MKGLNKKHKKTKGINTPYDDVFRTMLQECKGLIIPVVNEIFRTAYAKDVKIDFKENEIFMCRGENMEKRITDSSFSITDEKQKRHYHMECQSTLYGNMLVRMFEYDSQIALKHKEETENVLNVRFPESAVMYLRHNINTPDKLRVNIETPGGSVSYDIKTLKVKQYSLDEIYEKKLFFLLPFYIFTYESELKKINDSEERVSLLVEEYMDIVERLEELNNQGILDTYSLMAIKHMTKIVVNNLALKYENVKKGVESVMGGKVIEFEAKRIRDAARDADIKEFVAVLKELNIADKVIVKKIMERFKISKVVVEKYLKDC